MKTLKKARILLAMLLAVSVFSFAGCGDKNNSDSGVNDGTTTVEQTTEKTEGAGEDLKNDAKDLGDDVKDGAKDLVDGTDNTDNAQKNNTKETTK